MRGLGNRCSRPHGRVGAAGCAHDKSVSTVQLALVTHVFEFRTRTAASWACRSNRCRRASGRVDASCVQWPSYGQLALDPLLDQRWDKNTCLAISHQTCQRWMLHVSDIVKVSFCVRGLLQIKRFGGLAQKGKRPPPNMAVAGGRFWTYTQK